MIKPFIHLIDTPYGYYFFDVNTHTINKITSRKNKMKNYTEEIIEIMQNNLKLKFNKNIPHIEQEPLLGKKFNFKPYILAYLVMEVEKYFNITFSEEYILHLGLKTINDFSEYINKAIIDK